MMIHWRNFLGMNSNENTLQAAKKKYFQKALELHPNKGGSTTDFQNLQKAWNQAQKHYSQQSTPYQASSSSSSAAFQYKHKKKMSELKEENFQTMRVDNIKGMLGDTFFSKGILPYPVPNQRVGMHLYRTMTSKATKQDYIDYILKVRDERLGKKKDFFKYDRQTRTWVPDPDPFVEWGDPTRKDSGMRKPTAPQTQPPKPSPVDKNIPMAPWVVQDVPVTFGESAYVRNTGRVVPVKVDTTKTIREILNAIVNVAADIKTAGYVGGDVKNGFVIRVFADSDYSQFMSPVRFRKYYSAPLDKTLESILRRNFKTQPKNVKIVLFMRPKGSHKSKFYMP